MCIVRGSPCWPRPRMAAIEVGVRVPVAAIQDAIREVCRILAASPRDRPCWRRLMEDALWRELVSCILGSRVRFDIARSALERLDSAELLSAKGRPSRFGDYERDVLGALTPARGPRNTNRHTSYPFPAVAARRIRGAAERIYGRGQTVRELLDDCGDSRGARRLLVAEVPGLGPKQASLFLRNVGHAVELAVLDTHVLTYMNWVGLIRTSARTVSALQQYEFLEGEFLEHSVSLGYPADDFDLAVWVVVRVAKRGILGWRW